jgi:hypothetical protein
MNPFNQSNNNSSNFNSSRFLYNPSNNIQLRCARCEHPFIGNIKIGTTMGLICVDCYAPIESFNEKLSLYDKGFLKSLRIRVD